MEWSWLGYALAVLLMLAGLAGTIYPALPGLLLLAAGMLLAAWLGDFALVGMWPLIVIGVLAVLGMVVENLAGFFGAQKSGASRQALINASTELAGQVTAFESRMAGITENAKVQLTAAKIFAEHGAGVVPYLPKIGKGAADAQAIEHKADK